MDLNELDIAQAISELTGGAVNTVEPVKRDCGHDQGEYGTAVSGYSPAADGAKKCATCTHESDGHCDHPMVVADIEVNKLQLPNAPIEAEGCCTYWWPRRS